MKTDPLEAETLYRNAVKNLNNQEPEDEPEYSIPVKVRLSCPGETETWYGGDDSLSNSSVSDALRLYADRNPDEASRVAEEIGDKITKVRALAVVTKVALVKIRTAPKPRPKKEPGDN